MITEQVRTLSAQRFRRPAPELALTDDEMAAVKRVLDRMLFDPA